MFSTYAYPRDGSRLSVDMFSNYARIYDDSCLSNNMFSTCTQVQALNNT